MGTDPGGHCHGAARGRARFVRAASVLGLIAAVVSAAPRARAGDAPPPGIGECLQSAEASLKLRSEHKLRASRAQLLVCSSASCPGEVRQECMKRIDEINAAAPSIVLAVKNGAGKELSVVKVTVDGQVVADHLDGSALSVDPGSHEFTFEASGLPTVTQTIILHEGEKDRRETVQLGGGAPAATTPQASAQGAPSDAGGAGEPGTGDTQRMLGLVGGGIGVAGLAVGTIFGVLASSAWKTAQNECPSHTGCSPAAMNDRTSALGDATVSTVGFIAGGVLAVGGVVLYLTAPKAGAPRVGLEARPGGIVLSGGF